MDLIKNQKHIWLYFLTEFFLIIIGISVAFNLEKYVESIKNKKSELKYLIEIHEEISTELGYIEERITVNQYRSNTNMKLILILNSQDHSQKDSAMHFIDIVLNFETSSKDVRVYDILVNSGEINLITNFELKKKLGFTYGLRELVLEAQKEHKNYLRNEFLPYLGQFVDLLSIRLSKDTETIPDIDWIFRKDFKNKIYFNNILLYSKDDFYQLEYKAYKETKTLLDEEIKRLTH